MTDPTQPPGARPRSPELAGFRREIDAIDDQIVDLLARRFGVARAVAAYKAPRGIPVVIAERVEEVKARTRARGEAQGIDPAFMTALYDLIVDATCALEERLIGAPPAP
ncbi:MAG TPA: chorismate mutase [Alphaproteobacteria bacterium]|nr:chorismate mutase [Alphaproteobacteria bacterium]